MAEEKAKSTEKPIHKAEKESELFTVSSHGVTAEVELEKFDDLELFDMIDDVDSGNPFKMAKIMRRIFGKQHKKVLNGLRSKKGIVPASVASEFLIEVIGQVAPNLERSPSSTSTTEED